MSELDIFTAAATSPFDAIKQVRADGSEFWSARSLQSLMGYVDWRNMRDAIERARLAAENTGADVTGLFVGVTEKSTGGRPAEDVELTRYAAYLVAMNGDPRKSQVAAAQQYFAVQTRRAETAPELTRREILQMALDAEDRADAAEAKVAELEPKADLADTFLIADGSTRLVREVAKLLGMREGELRRFLVNERLIFPKHAACGDVSYDFYAQHAHHFVAKETVVNHTFGTCSHYTLRVTARGIELIKARLAKAQAA
ncbi:phage antirepressor KilAC domain-containing protein [Amycolatopsis sp. VS8301801F10]|uniref:phage antirepressor KilAC domain-containing protein n=1 Tax=Amycolatopsis sp. VS8301801F10 TaxID=2652442 RepID=UPI0038FCFFA1